MAAVPPQEPCAADKLCLAALSPTFYSSQTSKKKCECLENIWIDLNAAQEVCVGMVSRCFKQQINKTYLSMIDSMIKYEASQQFFPSTWEGFPNIAAFRCHTEDLVTKLRETAKALEVLVLLENNIWVCWLGLVFLCSFSGWTDFLDLQDFYDSKWSVSFFFFFSEENTGTTKEKI